MGLGGNSFGSLLLIFLISVVLFGTKRLKSIGSDLGAAIRSFREGMEGRSNDPINQAPEDDVSQQLRQIKDHQDIPVNKPPEDDISRQLKDQERKRHV